MNCKICDKEIEKDFRQMCYSCFTIQERIEEYLKAPKAREKVIALLEPYYLTEGTNAIIETLTKNFNRMVLIVKMSLFKESEKK
jgi:hypothetical protein